MNRKVLLIGWDAADWKVATPLMDAGEMPNLAKLVDQGVMGNMATLFPILSPMLWTSIATGKRAYKHGIHGFAEPDPRTGGVRPITNLSRKTKAIWNILNQNGLRSNVVGWWPSHPAEPIDGVMVSNHFQQVRAKKGQPWKMLPGTVHPPGLADNLAPFRVHPGELDAGQLLPFVPDAAKIDLEKDTRLGSLAKILAETASVHAAATALMQLEPWDFMAVYYDSIDHFCHGFMKYHPPRLKWVPEQDFEIYQHVINGAYRFHDLMLGTLLRIAGDDTTVILLSDHGFHPDHLRPRAVSNEPAGPADEHRPFGIFAMKGPGVKQDELIFGANLLDVAPTVLSLFGLPVGADMDGRVLSDAFQTPPPLSTVESWDAVECDAGRHPEDMQVDLVDAHEAMQQLVELGYIDKPDEKKEVAVAQTVRELRYNLARSYIGANMLPEAIELSRELWEEFPDESRFGVKLLESQLDLERTGDARETLRALRRRKAEAAKRAAAELKEIAAADKKRKDAGEESRLSREETRKRRNLRRKASVNKAAFAFLEGRLLQAEGDHEAALEQFAKAEEVQEHNRPALHMKVGESLLALGRRKQAQGRLEQALEADPVNPQLRLALGLCHLGLNRPRKALDEAAAAVGLTFHFPPAHFLRARALRRLGRREEAVAAFRTALGQNPVYPEARRQLADLLRKMGRTAEAAEQDKLAVAAEERIADFRLGRELPRDASLEEDVRMEDAIGVDAIGETETPGPLNRDTVVVVSGLPRSGTSMMMQMLAAGGLEPMTDGVRQPDESNPKGYFELEAVKATGKDRSWVEHAPGKAVKVIAQLLPGLPPHKRYRIVFMERPLSEVTASQSAMIDKLGGKARKISPRKLAASYRRHVEQIGELLRRHAGRVSVLPVAYHEALANPREAAARVNAFLGGDLDEAAMAAAIDPKLRRQRAAG